MLAIWTGFVAIIFLVGCCGTPEKEILIETIEVKVPVYEPCPVVQPDPPRYATEGLRKNDTDFEKIRTLLVERRQRSATEAELRLLLDACTDPLNPLPN
jgi:hypothetical protein